MIFFEFMLYFVALFRAGEAFAPLSKALVLKSPQIICKSNNKNRRLFASSDDTNLEEIQRAVGLTDTELKRIVSRVPEVGEYSATEARVCVETLKTRLSLTDVEFKKKIVLRLPQCLGYDFETDIGPSLSQLQSYLNMSDDELRSFVLKCPQIIGLDFSTEVEPKINALRDDIGADDDVASIKDEILKKPASLNLAVRGGVSPSKKPNT